MGGRNNLTLGIEFVLGIVAGAEAVGVQVASALDDNRLLVVAVVVDVFLGHYAVGAKAHVVAIPRLVHEETHLAGGFLCCHTVFGREGVGESCYRLVNAACHAVGLGIQVEHAHILITVEIQFRVVGREEGTAGVGCHARHILVLHHCLETVVGIQSVELGIGSPIDIRVFNQIDGAFAVAGDGA